MEDAVDTYFRQCALSVTAADLAVMAGTLASGGVNPVTGVRVTSELVAEQVLTVMATCGMYDYSGRWMLHVGLPAKSGVSGGLVAVSPGQFGVGVFSPRLDARGNSVRAVAVLRELSARFGLHVMHHPGPAAPAVCARGDAATAPSGRVRGATAQELLRRHGGSVRFLALQGRLDFTEAEAVLDELDEPRRPAAPGTPAAPGWLVLDLHRVVRVEAVAGGILDAALTDLTSRGTTVVLVDPAATGGLRTPHVAHPDLDAALAWCEDRLLGSL